MVSILDGTSISNSSNTNGKHVGPTKNIDGKQC